jgi:beta-lactamase class A
MVEYLSTKKADVGVAVLALEDGDTMSVNGDKMYSLMSVAKFPQALLLLHQLEARGQSLDTPIMFTSADLTVRTGSTLRKDHPGASIRLPLREALRYSIGQSDNITSNKFFEIEGGPAAVEDYVHGLGISDVHIVTDYRHLGEDAAHDNTGTPRALVRLLEKFYRGQLLRDSSQSLLWKLMVESTTGPDRLKGELDDAEVAHKTGTSGTDSTGAIIAMNDIGIITLPDGRHFAIAVFVSYSRETPAETAAIISHLCKTAWDYFATQQQR